MKKNILCMTLALAALGAAAQEGRPEGEVRILTAGQHIVPYKISVPFNKTVHILFPAEVRYVDLGSTDIIAGKADGVENVVRVKAAVREFPGETNFSVITGDGEVFDAGGARLTDREPVPLDSVAGLDTTDACRQVFTLFYRNTGEDNPGIRFAVTDNFGTETALDIPFTIEDGTAGQVTDTLSIQ